MDTVDHAADDSGVTAVNPGADVHDWTVDMAESDADDARFECPAPGPE